MPEIATMAALERLDMLLNDSMYGILFRDINMKRTFVDQHFSRMLSARAGIIINTGEDNYLHDGRRRSNKRPRCSPRNSSTKRSRIARALPDGQIGLGDAYEIDPGARRTGSCSRSRKRSSRGNASRTPP